MSKNVILMFVFSFLVMNSVILSAISLTENMNETKNEMEEVKSQDHLLIVWTSGDPDVAHKNEGTGC